ncbi:MAG: hypothetical protein L3J87_05075, partial [Thermoplasmata archaeon]|nr:hypothetical protein [Thermoplasmata archaeon]
MMGSVNGALLATSGVSRELPSATASGPKWWGLTRRSRWILLSITLAVGIPEVLTGSTNLNTLFVNPLRFVLFTVPSELALYGAGVLLIREAAVVWKKGWATVLLWGGAYGILEEGFAVHTFFMTSGSPVGALGSYGHYWGVNWVWAVGLMIFHAVYSIALPILLVRLFYPETSTMRWLTRRQIGLVGGLYAADVVILGLLVGSGPATGPFLFFAALVVGLILLGLALPPKLFAPRAGPMRVRARTLALLAATPFASWVVLGYILHSSIPEPVVTIGLIVGANALAFFALLRWAGTETPLKSGFAVAEGLLVTLLLWTPLVL